MRWVLPIVMSLVLLSSASARAEPQSQRDPLSRDPQPQSQRQPEPGGSAEPAKLPEPVLTPEPARQWYGWQILLADLVTIGAAFGTQSDYVGVTGYFVLAPMVHLGNGEAGRAAGSVGLRLASPLLFANLTANGRSSDYGDYVDGLWIGAVLASVVDTIFLSWKTPALPEPAGAPKPQPARGPTREPARQPERKPWFEPRIQPLPRGMSLGVVGGF